MHGSWGNLISADDAFERMGADVMRWLYSPAAADAEHPLRLRAGRRDQAPAADAVELGALPHRLRRRSRASSRVYADLDGGVAGVELRPLDRWLLARVQQLVARGRDGLRRVPHRRRRSCRRDVRRGPLELVHPPLAAALLLVRRGGVPHAVDRARAARARVRADHAVPRRAPVADAGRRTAARMRPSRCISAGWPRVAAAARRRGAARRDRHDAAGRPARASRARGGGC